MVACGWRHTITVAESGNLYTFGWSKYGQLGHGNFQDHLVPHQVHALRNKKIRSVCSTAPLFILSCIFLLLFNLVIIRHQSHEEGTKNRYLSCITQRVMGSNLFTDCWRLAAYSCFGQRWPNVWMGLKQGHIKSITYSMHHLPFANCM